MRRRPQTLKQQIEPLNQRRQEAITHALSGMSHIEDEADRIASLMRNARSVLDDLDRQFEEQVGLTPSDIKFLFLATGIQCLRQYIFSNDAFRLSSTDGDRMMEAIVPKRWQDILLASVPYDATRLADGFEQSTGLGGSTHRYRTLGHDPLFGWVFGPVNIITDSLTKSNFEITYSVQNMCICGHYPAGTFGAFGDCIRLIQCEKMLLPISVMRQALHYGSDYFTKQGLPVPVLPSLNNEFAKTLVTQFNVDMYSITRGSLLSILINNIISYVHSMFYAQDRDGSSEAYAVRTRKLVTYSNIIASASNIIAVAVQDLLGNPGALKQLDVGGFLVTIYRIVTDSRYTYQLKMEFMSKRFLEIANNGENG